MAVSENLPTTKALRNMSHDVLVTAIANSVAYGVKLRGLLEIAQESESSTFLRRETAWNIDWRMKTVEDFCKVHADFDPDNVHRAGYERYFSQQTTINET